MPIWGIVLIVVAVVAIIALSIRSHNAKLKKLGASNGSAPGIPIRNAVESIPVYGGIIKTGRTVLTPLHKLNNVFNEKITAGLQHIPVAGKYLAIPNQIAGSAVHKITDYFGLN